MSHDKPEQVLIDAFLSDHPEYEVDDGKLKTEFKFADFKAAFSFMKAVADEAERLNHHPTMTNTYNKVSFELWTHETGGISHHDLELAKAISQLATKQNA
ncbi:MAG TPA: 4a-hydroxytetrahydrobiopterin dehydratase [Candidatus Nanoarchaeia archaeon]|nr:4a-hydroxytetrahydrobiopterin dehydratase [Candidatus Nanoarchaeia archaeon]